MFTNLAKSRRPGDLLLVFQTLYVILLFLFYCTSPNFDPTTTYKVIGLITVIHVSNFVLGEISSGDNYIFLVVSALLIIGIVTEFRINPSYGILQMAWSIAGTLLFYVSYFFIKYFPKLDKFGNLYVLLAAVLTLITLIFETARRGARNWLQVSSNIYVQPSESSKILVMFTLASFYANYNKYKDLKYASFIIIGIVYFFILCMFIQKDLGTIALFLAMYLAIQFVYKKNCKMITLNLVFISIGALLDLKLSTHIQTRVHTWLDPWSDAYSTGRQTTQSFFAIAEEGFLGSGIGMGYPDLIPFGCSDPIFPLIYEGIGTAMGIAIIMPYMILAHRRIRIALDQEYTSYRVLALCVSVLFCRQAFVHIGSVTKPTPLTGLTLPFASYGRSSMLSSFICLDILQVTSEDLSFRHERREQ